MRHVLVLNQFALPRTEGGGTRHIDLFSRVEGWQPLFGAGNKSTTPRRRTAPTTNASPTALRACGDEPRTSRRNAGGGTARAIVTRADLRASTLAVVVDDLSTGRTGTFDGVPTFVAAALRGEPLVVHRDGEQSRDFTFVDSVTEVLARAVRDRTSADRPINRALGTRTTVNGVIALLAGLLGRPLDVEHRPTRAGDVRHSQASSVALHRLFPGVEAVPVEERLRRTIAWMESRTSACTTTEESSP